MGMSFAVRTNEAKQVYTLLKSQEMFFLVNAFLRELESKAKTAEEEFLSPQDALVWAQTELNRLLLKYEINLVEGM